MGAGRNLAAIQRVGRHERFDFVETQVSRNRHAFNAGFVIQNLELFVGGDIQRECWTSGAGRQREAGDQVVRQHGDLVAGHVDGRQPGARDGIVRRTRQNAQAGGSDVDAEAPADTGESGDRERVIDFGRAGIVDGNGLHFGERQIAEVRRLRQLRKTGAFGEALGGETPVVPMVGVGESATAQQKRGRRFLGCGAGGFKRFHFKTVAIRLDQQGFDLVGQFRR